MVVYSGVDNGGILRRAESEADVLIWDGGNNDLPFFTPDLLVTVRDPLRPGHELGYHPGETNLRMADVLVVNKVDSADRDPVATVANACSVNAHATLLETVSPVTLEAGPSLVGARVLVVEDGPTITHGGMLFGAGAVATRAAGVTTVVDPRPYAVGSIARTYRTYPAIGAVLPAMGHSAEQLADLEATIRATPCDVVVSGTHRSRPGRRFRAVDPPRHLRAA